MRGTRIFSIDSCHVTCPIGDIFQRGQFIHINRSFFKKMEIEGCWQKNWLAALKTSQQVFHVVCTYTISKIKHKNILIGYGTFWQKSRKTGKIPQYWITNYFEWVLDMWFMLSWKISLDRLKINDSGGLFFCVCCDFWKEKSWGKTLHITNIYGCVKMSLFSLACSIFPLLWSI